MNNKEIQKLRLEKGITLLALVITMVILIILATVTISATIGDNGLINQSKRTKDMATNSIAKENEDLNRLEQEYANMMSEDGEIPEPPKDETPPTVNIVVGTKTENSIEVTVNAEDKESGMIDNPKYTYYIKKTGEEDSEYQEKATDVTEENYAFTGLTQETSYSIKVVVRADKAGNIGQGTAQASTTKPSGPTIEEKLKEGDYVNYVDGKGQTRKCVVLYDNTSGYGIQIITMDTVADVTLGDGNNFTTSMNSYNSAISTLNSKAEEYNNSIYSSDARCVGSVPNNKNSESGMYNIIHFTSIYSGKLRDADNNYETDYNKMRAIREGIHNIGKVYWLASRNVYSSNVCAYFYVRIVRTPVDLGSESLFIANSGGYAPNTKSYSHGLRPVFTLKPGIKVTGGDGSSGSPYELGL